jgi:hypothetical protein
MNRFNKTAIIATIALLFVTPVGIAGDDHDHDHDDRAVSGGPLFGLPGGLLWSFETEDDDHVHYQVIVAETNRLTTNGVLYTDRHGHVQDSGIQVHDACVVAGFDFHEDLLEAYADATGEPEPFYPYAYIIAGTRSGGLNDAGAIAAATWFWAELGFDIRSHGDMHTACDDVLGGESHHADRILFRDEHAH